MSLIDLENEDYRRDILTLLESDPDYEMSEISLSTGLRNAGNPASRDRLKTQCYWLKEQGLVTIKNLMDSEIISVKLTQRGSDVAQGLVSIPGIAKLRH